MKTLVKWVVKHYVSKDTLKAAIHAANESLAKVEVDEAKTKVVGVANDVSAVVGSYLNGYADDGRIDPEESREVCEVCYEETSQGKGKGEGQGREAGS